MDFGGNMFCLNNRDQNNNTNGNSNSNGFTWGSSTTTSNSAWNNNTFNVAVNPGLANTMMFHPHANEGGVRQDRGNYMEEFGGGLGMSHVMPDPHLTCLKLGKRHYFEDVSGGSSGGGGGSLVDKRGIGYCSGGGGKAVAAGLAVGSSVARCQVDGCHVGLMNAKEYHRRHKVCEMHSKAPKVVVLGLEQRFCQQCSRKYGGVATGFLGSMLCQSLMIQREVVEEDLLGTMREEERAPMILFQGVPHKVGVLSLFCHLGLIHGFHPMISP